MSDELLSDEPGGAGVDSIAVIAAACRFPQARDVDAFWENLRRGVDAITDLSEEELAAVPEAMRGAASHVKASASLDGIDRFDAGFFGLSPREAAAMDPQQRFFFEVGWEALERAGYPPEGLAAGVYAGVSPSRYLDYLSRDPALAETMGLMQLTIGNDKDHIATRLSYLLDLRGPSVAVQTACSASLVAVHLACQSLLGHECDLALAGGCSIPYPHRMGYIYEEGGALSPDGRCRAFDARARGTALGNGVGLVVLKRLEDAVADGDHIHAVIRGTAINNDGAAKVGYTAPSVEGQRRVIEEAVDVAGLEPWEISYVEAHGTGTSLGDPIEVEALRQAFADGKGTGERSSSGPRCALGSVKTNIGHCDTASGIAGLIKAILCLEHETLVPSLHFEKPNPQIDFASTPFFVNTETRSWDQTPRYAGVSSFGIGGTNAHVVLGEAPRTEPSGPSREHQLLTLSARSAEALAERKEDLRAYLGAHPGAELADVAFTSNAGRRAFLQREAVVCRDREELLAALAGETAPERPAAEGSPQVVFLFPGHGTGDAALGQDLYHREAAYREAAERCLEILPPSLGAELRRVLFDGDSRDDEASRRQLARPSLLQPAIFLTEYALAHLWMAWGLRPAALLGHSLGEVAAAALAGVLTLDDALALVAERGRRTEELGAGAMLAVPMSEEEIAPYLGGGVSLAAVNGPGLVVLSGPVPEIDTLEEELAAAAPSRLATGHAFHSPMVEPMVEPIAELAAGFDLGTPEIPYLSSVTGTWMRAEDATDPRYWTRHLRQTVRFHDALAELRRDPDRLLLEVGPGKMLTRLANRGADPETAVASLGGGEPAERSVLEAAGELWRRGGAIDWQGFYAAEKRRRLPLPTYPFERRSHWFESSGTPAEDRADPLAVRNPPREWFFLPTWKQAPLTRAVDLAERLEPGGDWLVLAEGESGLGEALRQRLQELQQRVALVEPGERFAAEGDGRFTLDPAVAGGWEALFGALGDNGWTPRHIVYAASAVPAAPERSPDRAARAYAGLIRLAQAIGGMEDAPQARLAVVTCTAERILDEPGFAPEQAALHGVAQVLPKELPRVRCQSLDFELSEGAKRIAETGIAETRIAEDIVTELALETADERVAYRRGRRWLPAVEPLPMNGAAPPAYRRDGVYLITHGLQEIGLALAERLVRAEAAVVLVDRSFFPPPAEWDDWLAGSGEDDPVSRKIARLRHIGGRVVVRTADPAERERLRQVQEEVEDELGAIRGVFHLDPPAPETGLIAGKPAREPAAQVASRIREAHNLEALFGADLDFLVLFSSNAAESGGLGQVDQAAACGFLERFAHHLDARGRRALAIAWGPRKWQDEDASRGASFLERQLEEKREHFGMTPEECLDALERALGLAVPQVIVSTRDFQALMEQQGRFTADFFQQQMRSDGLAASNGGGTAAGETPAERPELDVPYEAPRSEVEKLLAAEWELFFGLRRLGIHDSFFELGGHSLLAVQILKRVNETFSTRLGLGDFFDAPTIAGLAERLSGSPVSTDEAELAELLSEIEGLSDDELEAALETQGGDGSGDDTLGLS